MNGDGALSLFLHPLYGMDLKDVTKDARDGGRRCGGWVGRLRHPHASGLSGLMTAGASKATPSRKNHTQVHLLGSTTVNPTHQRHGSSPKSQTRASAALKVM